MPINVTVTNSGKISLQVFVIKILVFTLAASRLNCKVSLVSLGLSRIIFTTNSKFNGYNMKSRLYTLSEAWSGVNWADLMAAQGAFGADF